YAWGEEQVQRFIGDIVQGIRKGEEMFIGTMQLSAKHLLTPRGEYYQEVIDGQQRLSTCALILRALRILNPSSDDIAEFTNEFRWIETRVSNGQMQEYLDEALLNDQWEKSSELNVYANNLKLIIEILKNCKDEEEVWLYDPDELFKYITQKLRFVVIETEAGLSKTLQIFNTINTAGLDLNGGDLFKVRAYEYFKDHHQNDCFNEISEVYETIDRENSKKKRSVCSILDILNVYQSIIVGKTSALKDHTGLPIVTIRFAPETFFERLFDTRFGIQQWENFTSVPKLDKVKPIIDLEEIIRVIKGHHELDSSWHNEDLDPASYLDFYLIEWSRYAEYEYLWHVFRFAYQEEENINLLSAEYMNSLARLFTIYSVIYGKKVNEIHTFIGNQIREMFTVNANQIIDSINKKIQSTKATFQENLDAQFAWYPVPKNLLCRLLEWLSRDITQQQPKDTKLIFEGWYDIEHIQSVNDIKQEQRKDIEDAWGERLNGLGNLMLLEADINRSVGNKTFIEKIERYGGGHKDSSKLCVPNTISRVHQAQKEWMVTDGQNKLAKDKRLLMDFIFGDGSVHNSVSSF
nr:DUF262 domain-containing protein [Desulfobulbaceae bacterium]